MFDIIKKSGESIIVMDILCNTIEQVSKSDIDTLKSLGVSIQDDSDIEREIAKSKVLGSCKVNSKNFNLVDSKVDGIYLSNCCINEPVVAVPYEIDVICSYAFKNCSQIRQLYLPDKYIKISQSAFRGLQDCDIICRDEEAITDIQYSYMENYNYFKYGDFLSYGICTKLYSEVKYPSELLKIMDLSYYSRIRIEKYDIQSLYKNYQVVMVVLDYKINKVRYYCMIDEVDNELYLMVFEQKLASKFVERRKCDYRIREEGKTTIILYFDDTLKTYKNIWSYIKDYIHLEQYNKFMKMFGVAPLFYNRGDY